MKYNKNSSEPDPYSVMKSLEETIQIPSILTQSGQFYYILTDLQGKYTYVNNTFCNRFGVEAEAMIGVPVTKTVHPDDMERCLRAVEFCIQHPDKTITVEIRKVHPDDGYIDTRWEFTLLLDEENKPSGIQCLGVDNAEAIVQKELQFILNQINAYINGVEDFLIVIDHDRRILRANKTFAKLVGRGYKELKGCLVTGILPSQYEGVIKEFHNPDIFHTQYSKEISCDNNNKWCEFITFPNPMGTLIVLRDITNTIKVKEDLIVSRQELEHREKWFRNLLVNAIDSVFISDAQLNITYATSSVITMLGYEPEELIGRPAFEFIHPEDVDTAMVAFGELFQQKPDTHSIDMRVLRKDGTWLWVEAMGKNKFDDPLIDGMIVYLNDINVRKKAEEELIHSEKKYKSVVENSYNGIIISNYPGKILSVNSSLCQMFGYTEEEFLSKSVQDFLDFTSPYVLQAMKILHTTGRFKGEVSAINRSGKFFLVEMYASLLYEDETGRYFSTIVRDIDEERKVQRQLQKREEMLSAISMATGKLVMGQNMNYNILDAMKTIGNAIQADRVYLFENQRNPTTGEWSASQRFEWNAGLAPAHINNPDLQEISFLKLGPVIEVLKQNRQFASTVPAITDEWLKEFLISRNTISVLLVPVFINDSFWGFAGFDDCKSKRKWPSFEVDILKTFGASLAGAVERLKSEQMVEESRRRYKMLFEENPVPLISFYPHSLSITNVNKSAIEHYGYTAYEFLGLKISDLFEMGTDDVTSLLNHSINVPGKPFAARHHKKNNEVIDVELTVQQLTEGSRQINLLLIHDVTESLRLQREKELMNDVADILIQPGNLHTNLSTAIDRLRNYLGWEIAELWTPNYDHSQISIDVFCAASSVTGADELYNKWKSVKYTLDNYLYRDLYRDKGIEWIENIETTEILIRKKSLLEFGIRSAIVIPVLYQESVTGILFFFSKAERANNENHSRLLTILSKQLGAEIEKRKKETELELLFSVTSDGMAIVNTDGAYKKVNPSFCAITGYSEEELMKQKFSWLVYLDDLEDSKSEFKRMVVDGTGGTFENRIVTKEGEVKWLEWTTSFDPYENIVVASARDVSEKKLAEQKLAAASNTLQYTLQENKKILDYSQDIILTFTKDGRIQNINPACFSMLGYKPEEMVGELNQKFVHPDYYGKLQSLIDEMGERDKSVKEFELQFIHKDETLVQMSWSMYWSGADQICFSVGRDITAQKEAEEALQESETRFRLFMDNSPAAAWITDEDGVFVYHNKQHNDMFLMDEGDIGKSVFDIFPNQYAEAFYENNRRALDSNKPIEVIETVPLKDGTEAIQLVYKFPILLKGNRRMLGAIGIDITMQKQAEERLRISEQTFRSFMNNNPVGAWINDEEGRLVFLNRFYGSLIRSKVELKEGNTLYDIYSNEVVKEILQQDREMIATGQTLELINWAERADGSRGFFVVYKFPLQSFGGKTLIGGVILDLTEKQTAEEELIRIKKAVDNASDAVIIYNHNMQCIYLNQGFETLFGYDVPSMNTLSITSKFFGDMELQRRIMTDLRTTGSWDGDLEVFDKEGNRVYVSLRANVIFNEKNDVASYVGVITNITDRILADKKIKDTAHRLTNIMESITEGMMIIQPDWSIEYVNPSAEKILKTEATQLMHMGMKKIFPVRQYTSLYRKLEKALKQNKPVHVEEYFENYDSWLDISAYPLENVLTVYFRDVTERRRAQMQLALERESFEAATTQHHGFKEIAHNYLRGMEVIYPGSFCSLLLLNQKEQTVQTFAAPSLPETYSNQINGLHIGPNTGSCGTAMFTGEMVIAGDIETDEKWANYKEVALQHNLRACWSQPLINSQGKVFGSFAIYYTQKKGPEDNEISLMQRAAHFITIIYENIESERMVRLSNERYELATKATNEAIWDWDLLTDTITWSNAFFQLFGYDKVDDKNTYQFWANNVHPDDQPFILDSLNQFVKQRKQNQWTGEYRFRKKDGTYANVLDKGFVLRDETKNPYRMVGSLQDISERIRLEAELREQQVSKQKLMAKVVVDVQEKERAEIGKELHDNVNQILTTTKLYLEMAKLQEGMREELITRSSKNIADVIHEIRQLSRSLVPHSISDLGMVAAINDLIETIQLVNVIDIEFHHEGDLEKPLSGQLKVTIFRIIQEQINNIVKYAYADNVIIKLINTGKSIRLDVADNGVGFDPKKVKRGLGISNIISRADMLDGKVNLISAPGKGCTLEVEIPL